MKIQDIAQKMARGISVKKDADNASAPLVAYMIYVATSGIAPGFIRTDMTDELTETQSDAFGALRELYMLTFEAAASTKKKAVQSYFSRMAGLMSALVEHENHEVMADTIDAEMALVRFEDGKLVRAQDAKRFPKAPQITRAADAIRRDWASEYSGALVWETEHVDITECSDVPEILKTVDEEITRLAEVKASLEAFRKEVLDDIVGEPVQFEIGGDTNVAPSFSLK